MPQAPMRAAKPKQPVVQVVRDGLHTSWDDAVETFLRDRRRTAAASTLELYRDLLTDRRLRAFLTDQDIATPDDFTGQALKDFETELQDAGMKPSSVRRRHMLLKQFLAFALKRGMTEDHDVRDVTAPKKEDTAPGIISRDDERRLLAAARNPRDRFIVAFLMGTGLRRAELLALTVEDIHSTADGDVVHVRLGKGAKDRFVPLDSKKMGVELTRQTRRYIDHDRPSDTESRALFLSTVKDGGDYPPLSVLGLRSMLRRLELATGIECHPHLFRHSYGTRAIQAGVPAMAVMRLMGHTALDMVSRYVHYDNQSLVEALN